MSIIILDNVFPDSYIDILYKTLSGYDFHWVLNNGYVNVDDGGYQLVHMFYQGFEPKSKHFNLLEPILQKIQAFSIVKIKANLTWKTHLPIKTNFHTDIQESGRFIGKNSKEMIEKMKTFIFYVNSNDGYTEFENGEIVKSVANRLVQFNTNMSHRAVTTTDTAYRMVININVYSSI